MEESADKTKPVPPGIPLPLVLFGGVMMSLVGGMLAATLLGYFPMPISGVKAPLWVLWATAMVFLCAGLAMLVSRIATVISGWLALVSVLCFVFIFNWIAFGPGERSFTVRSSLSSVSVSKTESGPASETGGRIVFGIFAGAMDALIGYGLIVSLRNRVRRRDSGD